MSLLLASVSPFPPFGGGGTTTAAAFSAWASWALAESRVAFRKTGLLMIFRKALIASAALPAFSAAAASR